MSSPSKSRQSKQQDLIKGVSFMTLSAFCFALMNLFSRLAGPLPPTQKAWFRNLMLFIAGLTIYLVHARQAGRAEKISPKAFGLLMLRAGFGIIGLIANFAAVDRLALSDATILAKLSPFFTIIFSYFLMKEKINKVQWATLIMAFVGALAVVRPSFDNPNIGSYLIGFAGGMFAGLAYAFVRLLNMHGLSKEMIIMGFGGFSTLVLGPYVFSHWATMDLKTTAYMIMVGLLGTGGQYAMTSAYSYAPATSISILDYSQVIFSATLSALVLQEYPTWLSVLGYLIIFAASLILFLANRRAYKELS
ncbi:MAG: DMT family transporter [Eubacteriales bacterium]|nr:DMT family transporter [Eubacteriales bacterium]